MFIVLPGRKKIMNIVIKITGFVAYQLFFDKIKCNIARFVVRLISD